MSGRLRSWIVPSLVVLALGVLVALGWARRESYTPVGIGDEMPAYAAPTLDGGRLALDALRGRVVLLNVWATWCTPCRYEMPSLQRLHERLGPRGLDVVAVSVDELPGSAQAVERFVDAYDLTFPILLDPAGRIQDLLAVHGLPTTFVIARDGTVRERVLGGREWDQGAIAARIEALVEEGT